MDETHKRSAKVSVNYDPHTDTLYFASGDLRNSLAKDIGDGVLIQYHAHTKKIVGFIIHDFEGRFSRKEKPCRIPMKAILQPA